MLLGKIGEQLLSQCLMKETETFEREKDGSKYCWNEWIPSVYHGKNVWQYFQLKSATLKQTLAQVEQNYVFKNKFQIMHPIGT